MWNFFKVNWGKGKSGSLVEINEHELIVVEGG